MPAEAKKAIGKGRYCTHCRTKMGTHEPCVEVNNSPYHEKCNPNREVNCRIKLPEQMVLPYII